MKTVLDAVIEFKGEWPFSTGFMCMPSGDNDVATQGRMKPADSKHTNEYWVNVCSRNEFTALVAELASNFGECDISYQKHCSNEVTRLEGNEMKTVLDAVIEFKGDVSNAPVGGRQSEPVILLCIRDIDRDKSGFMSGGSIGFSSTYYRQVCTYKKFNALVDELASNFGKCDISYQKHCENEVTRLEGESVYAFASGQDVFIAQINTLAGIESQRYYIKECWCACVHQVEYADLGLLFHTKEEAESKCRELIGLPPLEPPVKLIDGKAYQFDYNGKEYVGICNTTIKYKTVHVMFESPIKNTKINSEFCTNIKPLTVA